MSTSLRHLAACAAALLIANTAWAARPLVTDDAGVLASSECELEGSAVRLAQPDAKSFWAQASCGIGRNTQLGLGGGHDKLGDTRSNGFAIGGKTALREAAENQIGLAVSYALSGLKPSGERARRDGSQLLGIATLDKGDWLYHANLGWSHTHEDSLNHAVWGLAVEKLSVFGPVDLMAEVFGEHRTDPWFQVGARWTVVPQFLSLDGAYGIQAGSSRPRQASLGFKLKF